MKPRKRAAPPPRRGPPTEREWADAARALARARIEVRTQIERASHPERTSAWNNEGPALLRVDQACQQIDWLAQRDGMTP